MTDDASVIEALTKVVAADPDNLPVRQHLAMLMLQAGQPQQALEHARLILARQPTDQVALALAADAASAAGESAAAAGYRQLLEAITAQSQAPPVSAAAEDPAPGLQWPGAHGPRQSVAAGPPLPARPAMRRPWLC
jgi:Tfp pilus assembly protein PilF